MSSESRVLRPFANLHGLDRALDDATFVVGGQRYDSGASVTLTHDKYLMSPVVLELAADLESYQSWLSNVRSGCENAALDQDDVEIVVVVESSYLRLADIACRVPVSKLGDTDRAIILTEGDRPRALQGAHSGAKVTAYLLVGREQPQVVLRPWRKGTWLASAGIRIRTDLASSGFVPRPLTAEVRKRLHLPDETVKFVEFDQSVLDPDVGDDAVELYVDEELLARMSASPGSSHSRILQLQLFTSVIEAMVSVAAADADFAVATIDDISGSLVYRAIELACGRINSESEDAKRSRLTTMLGIMRTDRQVFMSHVEAQCGLLREIRKAVTDD